MVSAVARVRLLFFLEVDVLRHLHGDQGRRRQLDAQVASTDWWSSGLLDALAFEELVEALHVIGLDAEHVPAISHGR